MFEDSIIFIDEGNEFILSDKFSKAIQATDNYYVIVSREGLPNLPYSVEEIYGIHNSGKYGQLRQYFQVFYHIYAYENIKEKVSPDMVVVGDSNSGFQFFKAVCNNCGIRCISAYGKSNIISEIKKLLKTNEKILIIADGATFGSEMERVTKYIFDRKDVVLYLPESFEWLLLRSGLYEYNDLDEILKSPSDYIKSEKFFSWERYFTYLITKITQGTYLQYSKNKLNDVYLNKKEKDVILNVMEKIDL